MYVYIMCGKETWQYVENTSLNSSVQYEKLLYLWRGHIVLFCQTLVALFRIRIMIVLRFFFISEGSWFAWNHNSLW